MASTVALASCSTKGGQPMNPSTLGWRRVTSPRNRGRSIPLLHRLDGLLIGGGEHVVASLTVARLAQVEPGHSAPISGQVFPHPRLLLPGHPLDPCRAFRGAAPVGSATHSPDGCGPSDRLSACHGAVASPSQSRTASATALHWAWRTPAGHLPGSRYRLIDGRLGATQSCISIAPRRNRLRPRGGRRTFHTAPHEQGQDSAHQ